MRRHWYFLATLLIFCSPLFAAFQKPDENTVPKLLALREESLAPDIVVLGEPADAKAKAFLDDYVRTIAPGLAQQLRAKMDARILETLILVGAAESTPEGLDLNQQLQLAQEKEAAWNVDSVWGEKVSHWALLSEGLTGNLPDMARTLAKFRQIEEFPAKAKPWIEEAAGISTAFQNAIDHAPSMPNYRLFLNDLSQLLARFKNGEATFEATRAELHRRQSSAVPHQIANEVLAERSEELTRLAFLRTAQAKSRGFRSWAEYKIAKADLGFSPAHQGLENKLHFLTELGEQLGPIAERVRNDRWRAMGQDPERNPVFFEDLSLTIPPDIRQLDAFFPPESIRTILETTLLESGFSKESLGQILLDDTERPGRNSTMGMMNILRPRLTHVQRIDATTLDILPTPEDSAAWNQSLMHILQTYGRNGIQSLQTGFHEAGHGTEYVEQKSELFNIQSYAQQELASTMFERFSRDPQLLWHWATAVHGEKPSLNHIQELVSNTKSYETLALHQYVLLALFDIYLWDYDFTAPGARSFLEQSEWAFNKASQKVRQPPSIPRKFPEFYRYFLTVHFTGALVEFYGYVYADLAARMAVTAISDELERISGRRSWYQQPQLAKLFIEKVYRQGWRKPFPESVESLTGQPFAVKNFIQQLKKELWPEDCAHQLSAPVHPGSGLKS